MMSARNSDPSLEVWKCIEGCSNYEVSTLGRVRNKSRNYVMKNKCGRAGYQHIDIVRDNKATRTAYLHRLVAEAFLPNTEGRKTVNHKNHDRSDNTVTNLEWATHSEQNAHKRKSVHRGRGHKVRRIDTVTGEILQVHDGIEAAGRWVLSNGHTENSCAPKRISDACRGKQSPIRFGFKWEYEPIEEIESEIWKSIPRRIVFGREGLMVSSLGRVKDTSAGRLRRSHNNSCGYPVLIIEGRHVLIHRLVAMVFIPNPEGKRIVNHIDGITTNAKLSNLEWATDSENVIHAYRTDLIRNKYMKRVVQYDLLMNKIQEFESAAEAIRSTGINKSSLYPCCQGKVKSAGGFIFRYEERRTDES